MMRQYAKTPIRNAGSAQQKIARFVPQKSRKATGPGPNPRALFRMPELMAHSVLRREPLTRDAQKYLTQVQGVYLMKRPESWRSVRENPRHPDFIGFLPVFTAVVRLGDTGNESFNRTVENLQWYKVRVLGGDFSGQEGWVMQRTLMFDFGPNRPDNDGPQWEEIRNIINANKTDCARLQEILATLPNNWLVDRTRAALGKCTQPEVDPLKIRDELQKEQENRIHNNSESSVPIYTFEF